MGGGVGVREPSVNPGVGVGCPSDMMGVGVGVTGLSSLPLEKSSSLSRSLLIVVSY